MFLLHLGKRFGNTHIPKKASPNRRIASSFPEQSAVMKRTSEARIYLLAYFLFQNNLFSLYVSKTKQPDGNNSAIEASCEYRFQQR